MREVVTTALDVLGLLMVVAGVVALLWTWVGPVALAAGGVAVLTAVRWVSRPSPVDTPPERVHW
jgi:hypothetical protein